MIMKKLGDEALGYSRFVAWRCKEDSPSIAFILRVDGLFENCIRPTIFRGYIYIYNGTDRDIMG